MELRDKFSELGFPSVVIGSPDRGLVPPRNSEVVRTSTCELKIIKLEELGRNFLDVDQHVVLAVLV